MREILFRGKTKNGEWIEGCFVKSVAAHCPFGYITPSYPTALTQIYTVTLGQYTGLTDKNGKKIFEGDIVDIQYPDTFVCNTVISYIGASFYGDDGNDSWELDGYASLEVIGNIHDNPELLGQ